jgi:molybdopterin-containing oxidoreductase family iron-sulfur binding subunit
MLGLPHGTERFGGEEGDTLMDKQRRTFLKLAGATALAGLSAPVVVNLNAPSAQAAAAPAVEKRQGKRLGMVIDMRKLYGRPDLLDKATEACHKVHNVPKIDSPKNEVKWIWRTPYANAFIDQSLSHVSKSTRENDFLVLCNHCEEPPCVRVCPTKATFVQKKTGIVAMDYHRCIGCRFCMMGCPYGARSFNWMDPIPLLKGVNPNFPARTRGVVEKCNFCGERLALGQEPACVEAVKEVGAIVFGDLNDPNSEISKLLDQEHTIQRSAALGTIPSVFYIV